MDGHADAPSSGRRAGRHRFRGHWPRSPAVGGDWAGKTEMLFPLIAHELGLNHRVAVVTPRIDVVLELAPRLQAAFAGTSMAVQYGGTPWPEAPTSLLVATTHQLLRYYHHFDLVIVDEVDAFPFSQTPMLAAAVAQANRGPTVYLSATPPRRLKRAARRGQMGVSFFGAAVSRVPVASAKTGRSPAEAGTDETLKRGFGPAEGWHSRPAVPPVCPPNRMAWAAGPGAESGRLLG